MDYREYFLRMCANLVGRVQGLGAGAAHVGALDIHCATCAGAIIPQQNRAAARQRANALHEARLVELAAAVIVEGAPEYAGCVVLEPAHGGGGGGGKREREREKERSGRPKRRCVRVTHTHTKVEWSLFCLNIKIETSDFLKRNYIFSVQCAD
jgi:hypothetical protein